MTVRGAMRSCKGQIENIWKKAEGNKKKKKKKNVFVYQSDAFLLKIRGEDLHHFHHCTLNVKLQQ